ETEATIDVDTDAHLTGHDVSLQTSALTKKSASLNNIFDPTVSGTITGNDINLGHEHGLLTGDAVVYHNGGGTSVGGLTEGTTYSVIRVDDDGVRLALTPADALSGPPIPLSGGATGREHRLDTPELSTPARAVVVGKVNPAS